MRSREHATLRRKEKKTPCSELVKIRPEHIENTAHRTSPRLVDTNQTNPARLSSSLSQIKAADLRDGFSSCVGREDDVTRLWTRRKRLRRRCREAGCAIVEILEVFLLLEMVGLPEQDNLFGAQVL